MSLVRRPIAGEEPVPKTVSAREAKNRLGALVDWVCQNKDEVIIENRGAPTAVIIPFSAYQEIKELKAQARRKEALARLEALREQVFARNKDLTLQEGDTLADRFSRELVEDLAKEGKIRFKKD